jgi:hypothetical protein
VSKKLIRNAFLLEVCKMQKARPCSFNEITLLKVSIQAVSSRILTECATLRILTETSANSTERDKPTTITIDRIIDVEVETLKKEMQARVPQDLYITVVNTNKEHTTITATWLGDID